MDTSNLVVNLSNREWSDEKKIMALKSDDKDELIDLVADEWKLWEFELEMACELNYIAIHISKLNGKIKVFSAHSTNNKGLLWFGPMKTHPNLRGKGMGKVQLYRCLVDLKHIPTTLQLFHG